MRSFTRNLMELLYIAHARIQSAAPRTVYDITGGIRNIDVQSPSSGYGYRRLKPNLLAASPGGKAQVVVGQAYQSTTADAVFVMDPQVGMVMPGELIGIQIGSSNAPVTPTDYRLAGRIPHGRRPPVSIPSRQDASLTDDNDQQSLGNWYGTFYYPRHQFEVTSIKLPLYRSGSPGLVTLEVKTGIAANETYTVLGTATTDGNTLPTSGTYEWREFILPGPVTLLPGVPYYIWCRQAANYVYLRRHYLTSTPRGYFNLKRSRFGDTSGSDYVTTLIDLYGTSPREIEYGGCDISGLTATNPTAEFEIRRLFTNRSGGEITVRECGIYVAFPDTFSGFTGAGGALCICRDVIDPEVVVEDGEVLAMTYTPQITV
ncbi:hypothetical protein [Dehalococcoides mccartyi]|uniref:hypothetical protein n=1 Tax=Dehalococcoides mccartyi TaxID=61435 RepID=UPI00122E135D|nr:hypothetical protein [Dehalococcoides mccartyi]